MIIALGLPLAVWLLLFNIVLAKEKEWRRAAVITSVLWTTGLVIMTELLSLVDAVIFTVFTTTWLAVALLLLFMTIRFKVGTASITFIKSAFYQKSDLAELLLFGGSVIIVGLIGIIALVAPPNTHDAMSYHMPRIVHWMLNQNIAHYPTYTIRQLYQPPLAEMILLHVQLLSGTDRFANLLQWLSMIGCMLGVSLIVKEFFGNKKMQLIAALITTTIPMGILQASSAKNDYVLAFWLVSLTYFIINYFNVRDFNLAGKREETPTITKNHTIYLIGLLLGLATLTKGTAYLFAFPLMIWFFSRIVFKEKIKEWLKIGVIVTILALALNAGHYIRNYKVFHHPLSPVNDIYTNQIHSFQMLISNFTRNISLHLVLPPRKIVVPVVEKAVEQIHRVIGMNSNDPRTTWQNNKYELNKGSLFSENHSGNFVHLILILIAVILFAIRFRHFKNRLYFEYLLSILAMVIIFNLYLKWQPWHSRLHLPLFILFSPFVVVVLSEFKKQLLYAISFVLFVMALPWVVFNSPRNMLGERNIFNTNRMQQYFTSEQDLYSEMLKVNEILQNIGCQRIGWIWSASPMEYATWQLLGKPVMVDIGMKNDSSKIINKHYNICAIVSCDRPIKNNIVIKNKIYNKIWSAKRTAVYTCGDASHISQEYQD